MIVIGVLISIFFVMLPTIIVPITHKVLRNKKVFYSLVVFSLGLIVAVSSEYNIRLDQGDKINFLISFSPLTFLILYKSFDNIILKKLNRHIHFYAGLILSTYWDEESKDVTDLEMFLQSVFLFIPFLWVGIGFLIF
jgi:hypothetical protein